MSLASSSLLCARRQTVTWALVIRNTCPKQHEEQIPCSFPRAGVSHGISVWLSEGIAVARVMFVKQKWHQCWCYCKVEFLDFSAQRWQDMVVIFFLLPFFVVVSTFFLEVKFT